MINITETDERVERPFKNFSEHLTHALYVGPTMVHRLYSWGYAMGYDPDCKTLPYSDLLYDAIHALMYEELYNRTDYISCRRTEGVSEATITPYDKCLYGDNITERHIHSSFSLYVPTLRREKVSPAPVVYNKYDWDFHDFTTLVRIAYHHGAEDGFADTYRYVPDEDYITHVPFGDVQNGINLMTYWKGVTQGEDWVIKYIERTSRDCFIGRQDPIFRIMTEQRSQESLLFGNVKDYKDSTRVSYNGEERVFHGIAAVENQIDSMKDENNKAFAEGEEK